MSGCQWTDIGEWRRPKGSTINEVTGRVAVDVVDWVRAAGVVGNQEQHRRDAESSDIVCPDDTVIGENVGDNARVPALVSRLAPSECCVAEKKNKSEWRK